MKNDNLNALLGDLKKSEQDSLKQIAEQTWHTTLGQYVERLLLDRQEVSLPALIALLEKDRDNERNNDFERLIAASLLDKLTSLTNHP